MTISLDFFEPMRTISEIAETIRVEVAKLQLRFDNYRPEHAALAAAADLMDWAPGEGKRGIWVMRVAGALHELFIEYGVSDPEGRVQEWVHAQRGRF